MGLLSPDPVVYFDEDRHEYWHVPDGTVVPKDPDRNWLVVHTRKMMGISEAMRIVGMVDTSHYQAHHAQRGTYTHHATALHDQGLLDDSTVDEVVEPYLDDYRKFLEAHTPVWSRIECLLADDISACAGTVDRIGKITVAGETQQAIVDIKTGGAAPWHQVQLAGYNHLVASWLSRQGDTTTAHELKRYGLYLRKGKGYTLTAYTDWHDQGVWTSALTLAHWIDQCR